jgi:FtsP/CotA-like multicopper oxidase with cupredoxin domain
MKPDSQSWYFDLRCFIRCLGSASNNVSAIGKRDNFLMARFIESRRDFLKTTGLVTGALLFSPKNMFDAEAESAADYTIRIKTAPIEIAANQVVSTTMYNGQFPGPLIRLQEGRKVTVDIFNETDTPEQLHWHGQNVSTDVDGAAEEGTPYIPAHGKRRIRFTPNPAGLRFYHTHNRAGADLSAGQYSGQVGPVYIEPKENPGRYDREVFLVLKEFEPTLIRGHGMAQDILSPRATKEALKEANEEAEKFSAFSGMLGGYEVVYRFFTINGRMLGHGEPIRVKEGERVLFHILNGSATEIRSLALPYHLFQVIALDGNPVPNPAPAHVLWLGTAERISAVVEMKHPGVWVMGDLADDALRGGMGIVVEYAGRSGKPQWKTPPPVRWSYLHFAKWGARAPSPDETIEMCFAEDLSAEEGFNRWMINGVAYAMSNEMAPASFHLKQGKRYRIRMRNDSDDIHPIHLHRHSFELTNLVGIPTAGVMKDVVMLGADQTYEIDFVADNPGLTLFHCHQQMHMDFGFMTLFDYV